LVNEINLVDGTKDDITWKFTASEEYSAASTYNAQFEGMVNSYMMEAVWKTWAPPKWLILQNQVWMADRLQKRGWPIAVIANFASGNPKRWLTYFSNADTP
jgi:hypothetical protein